MEDGFRDLNTQFLDYIQKLFSEHDTEDLGDRLRALVEEYETHADKLNEEAGIVKPEEEEETAAAHDADDDGEESGDEGHGEAEEDEGDERPASADGANFFGEILSRCLHS